MKIFSCNGLLTRRDGDVISGNLLVEATKVIYRAMCRKLRHVISGRFVTYFWRILRCGIFSAVIRWRRVVITVIYADLVVINVNLGVENCHQFRL